MREYGEEMGSLGWHPGWDGHLLLLYGEETQRRAGVAAWVRRGLQLGAKIFYTEPREQPAAGSLAETLEDEPAALEAMERGQLETVPADPSAYDPAFMTHVVDGALSRGYTSVRWAGDASTARSLIPPARHHVVERATDRLCRSRPLSVLCQYATPEAWHSVDSLVEGHSAGLRCRLFQAVRVDGGLAVAGELDVSNHEHLRELMASTTASRPGEPFVLDLCLVRFVDLAAARALLLGTRDLRDAGRLLLRAPQPQVAELLRLVGVDRMDGIVVEGGTQ